MTAKRSTAPKIKKTDYPDIFSINGKSVILEEKDLGIFNGILTCNVPYSQVLAIGGIWAPPYVSSDFLCEVRLFGEIIKTEGYTWSPREVVRTGSINGIKIESAFILGNDCRGGILSFTLTNQTKTAIKLPLSLHLAGMIAYNEIWDFFKQRSEPPISQYYDFSRRADFSEKNGIISWYNKSGAVSLKTSFAELQGDGYSPCWKTNVQLRPAQNKTFYLSFGFGNKKDSQSVCNELAGNFKKSIELSRRKYIESVASIFETLPMLKAEDKRLEQFYYRSLVPLILNKWHVPEFALDPYYSTGGINGGCVCCYLWDLGEGWEILNLYDAQTLRSHIKMFLKMGLGKHFAFLPIGGKPYGPWYPVNQEKIIFLVYYYVTITCDKAFLLEKDNGKTVLDQLIGQALHNDDPNKPVELIDYGNGNNHLELRRQYRYDNYVPDLNARRYANYKATASLCRMAGIDGEYLEKRADELKSLILKTMWSKKHKWFYHFDTKWNKDIRYTMQLYKLLGSGVLDKEQTDGLLSHLNEKEFLSDYGFHSLSKQDIAYDQIDTDNGGGGIYSGFAPQIIERLYKIRKPKLAEDILERILWWGHKTPYWGDSFVANCVDYRRDTPLQNTLGALAGAQCIIFGMFGVKPEINGDIVINPLPPAFSLKIELINLRIGGQSIDVKVLKDKYSVYVDKKVISSKIGSPIVIKRKKEICI
ncbi:MAG: hypothetical protein A2Y10_16040 [Planctomycetes bacterium GWF2_41_51]|nr:MAG: hypothetical protein A2Y10_16040 [Planctomycetes bacterium GWF2_41_51]HBG25648.1 hypothetical protein [Phycisphaerales bacterium]